MGYLGSSDAVKLTDKQAAAYLARSTDPRAAAALAKVSELDTKPRLPKTQPDYPAVLAFQLHALRLPEPVREHVFDEGGRKWRFDLAWVEQRVACEIDGGVFMAGGGRHQRGTGFTEDAEKSNAAVMQGWRLYRFTPAHIRSGYALNTLRLALVQP